jgi:hypothetical protein
MRYHDGLSHIYDVPDKDINEFERRRGICLRVAIAIKIIILAAMIYFFWL